jgi:hypothetical protein
MSCWSGHMPRMNEDQLRQASEAYYRAAYNRAWTHAWQSPMNPFSYQPEQQVHWQADQEPPVQQEASRARSTSLEEARPGDKTGAIDVAFVRVR